MLAPFKVLLIAFGIILLFLFSVGLVSIKADGYACAGGWEVGFQERVEVFHYGPIRFNAIPFKRECPVDRRFDPNNIDACVATGFCTLPTENETVGELN